MGIVVVRGEKSLSYRREVRLEDAVTHRVLPRQSAAIVFLQIKVFEHVLNASQLHPRPRSLIRNPVLCGASSIAWSSYLFWQAHIHWLIVGPDARRQHKDVQFYVRTQPFLTLCRLKDECHDTKW